MARTKKEQPDGDIRGRALVDIPRIGAKCGEFVTVPADVADALQAAGEFDVNAVEVSE